jgi:hypothetical protein
MGHGDWDRWLTLGLGKQFPESSVPVEPYLWQFHPWPSHLLGWRLHLGGAGDDFVAELVDAPAIEDDSLLLQSFSPGRHRCGDRVTNADRCPEVRVLPYIDRPRTWQLGAEYGGDQRAGPHAMDDDLVKEVCLRIGWVEMRRVHMAGYNRN